MRYSLAPLLPHSLTPSLPGSTLSVKRIQDQNGVMNVEILPHDPKLLTLGIKRSRQGTLEAAGYSNV